MKPNKDYFDRLMAAKNLSLRRLGEAMEMSHTQLSLTFYGKRRMQLEEAVKISELFGVPVSEVISNAGYPDANITGHQCLTTGILRGDGHVDPLKQGEKARIKAPEGLPPTVRAMQARTAGSSWAWMDGWMIFYDLKSFKASDLMEKFCVAKRSDGSLVVGTLRRGYHKGQYALSGPYSSESEEIDEAMAILLISC